MVPPEIMASIARALAVVNGHPDPDEYAARVVEALKAQQVAQPPAPVTGKA